MNPLVSIIIPSINNSEQLKECISGIENQTFRNFEIIVVIPKINDKILTSFKRFSTKIILIPEPESGIYNAMNSGIEKAKGQWLYFMGEDDRLNDENVLNEVLNIKDVNYYDLIIGKIKYLFSNSDSSLLKKNDGVFTPSWSNKMWVKNTIHHQGVFYKKELFEKQKYNLKYRILSDYDFNLNLFKKGAKVYLIDTVIAVCGTKGISKKVTKKLYYEEIQLKTELTHKSLKPFFKFIAFLKYYLKISLFKN